MTGLSYDDLARIGQQQEPPATPVERISRELPRPVTVCVVGRADLVAGTALAVQQTRQQPVAVVDLLDGHPVAALLGVRPVELVQLVAELVDVDRRVTPSGGVDAFVGDRPRPDLFLAGHCVIARSYPVILVAGDSDEAYGVADVVVHGLAWTAAEVARLAHLVHTHHTQGEVTVGRVVVAGHPEAPEPGVEARARRWFAPFPICPVPADPATVAGPLTWQALRPVTQTAYLTLAAATLDRTESINHT